MLFRCFSLFRIISSVLALDYSNDVYEALYKLSNYPRISYCSHNPSFVPGPLPDVCPKIEFCVKSRNTHIIQVIRPRLLDNELSGTSYIAVDEAEKRVIVVFRGTLSMGDAITDFTFLQCPYVPVLANGIKYEMFSNDSDPSQISNTIRSHSERNTTCGNCLVHCGVYVEFAKLIHRVKAAASPYLDKGYELVVLGHSLGGGYALLAGIEFLLSGSDPLLVSFGSLRIGNPNFNEWVDSIFHTENNSKLIAKGNDLPFPSYSRIYQETDIVPRLPPVLPGVIYTHSGLQFLITKVRLPHLKENVIFKGASNNSVNDGIDFKLQPGIFLPVYQHIHEFQRLWWPCDDSEYPL